MSDNCVEIANSQPTLSTIPLAIVIPLSSGKCALIDFEDLDRVCALKWSACWINSGWYGKSWANGRQVYLHRFVAGARKGQIVDHINGDTLDCRKANLRIVSALENCLNRRGNVRSKSGYKGVVVRGGRFAAQIKLRGITIPLGRFDTAESAAKAYDAAACELHGEFARLNFAKAEDHETVDEPWMRHRGVTGAC